MVCQFPRQFLTLISKHSIFDSVYFSIFSRDLINCRSYLTILFPFLAYDHSPFCFHFIRWQMKWPPSSTNFFALNFAVLDADFSRSRTYNPLQTLSGGSYRFSLFPFDQCWEQRYRDYFMGNAHAQFLFVSFLISINEWIKIVDMSHAVMCLFCPML